MATLAYNPRKLRRNATAASSRVNVRVQVDRELPEGAVVVVLRNGTSLGNATRVGTSNVYAILDTWEEGGTAVYTAHVTNGSYTGPTTAGFQVTIPFVEEAILLENLTNLQLEDLTNILLEVVTVDPGPEPVLMLYDTFIGDSEMSIEGHVPTVTESGVGSWVSQSTEAQFYLTDNDGARSIDPEGGDTYSIASIALPLTSIGKYRVRMVMYRPETALAEGTDGIVRLEMSSDESPKYHSVAIGADGAVLMDVGTGPVNRGSTGGLGSGGADASFIMEVDPATGLMEFFYGEVDSEVSVGVLLSPTQAITNEDMSFTMRVYRNNYVRTLEITYN